MLNANAAPARAKPVVDATIGWFDMDGFFADPDLWNREVAQAIAELDGVGQLTPKHWEVIELVRGRYFEMGSLPVMRLICRAVGLDPQLAHKLFASCRGLWRVAGLPNPGEEAKAYMD
jgi:TusE/DsrC/DsvC family sulfur relay protein